MRTDAQASPVLDLRRLSVEYDAETGPVKAVLDVTLSIAPGETLALVGESGSGKSATSLAVMRLIERAGGRLAAGEALFRRPSGDVIDLAAADERTLRTIRGAEIAMIFQEPMTSLNPVFTAGEQIAETLRLHRGMSPSDAAREAVALLERVRIPAAARVARRHPNELSGGMRQRVMIAMALACRPQLLICDEPTTALDVTVQAEILELMRTLQAETGMAMLFITHDMGVVAEVADRVAVMRAGRIVETGTAEEVFANPKAPYTRALLAAVPRMGSLSASDAPAYFKLADPESGEALDTGSCPVSAPGDVLLEVRNLEKRFAAQTDLFGRVTHEVRAVNDLTLTIRKGETLALVGESGCGKSTTGRAILDLITPDRGDFYWEGRSMASMSAAERREARLGMQMIFQDPYASLDPRRTVVDAVEEPMLLHTNMTAAGRRRRAAELFERVGLTSAMLNRYPHEFSGGQRQRICIARALALNPKLIIADESVAALDVSIRAQVVNLMMQLQADLGIAYLFISHDMGVVERMSHRVAVMYMGGIVEQGTRRDVFTSPTHPYTKRLLSAVPVADPSLRRPTLPARPTELPSPVRRRGEPAPCRHYAEISPGHLVLQGAL